MNETVIQVAGTVVVAFGLAYGKWRVDRQDRTLTASIQAAEMVQQQRASQIAASLGLEEKRITDSAGLVHELWEQFRAEQARGAAREVEHKAEVGELSRKIERYQAEVAECKDGHQRDEQRILALKAALKKFCQNGLSDPIRNEICAEIEAI